MMPFSLRQYRFFASLALLVGCSRTEHRDPRALSSGDASTGTAPAAVAPADAAGVPEVSAPIPAPPDPPRGTVTLVVERVVADCGGGLDDLAPKSSAFPVGHDLLVVVQGEDPKSKPEKSYVFCPPRGVDGGTQQPRLDTWQNCRAFPSCKVIAPDAGSSERVEVVCGNETVVLEVEAGRTVLRGSFGTREIGPHPFRIAPVKVRERRALVDC